MLLSRWADLQSLVIILCEFVTVSDPFHIHAVVWSIVYEKIYDGTFKYILPTYNISTFQTL